MERIIEESAGFDTPELAERYDRISTSQFETGVHLVQELGVGSGDRVLDLGCGTGRLIEHILTRFGDTVAIVGLEPSEYRLAQRHVQTRQRQGPACVSRPQF